MNEFIVEGNLGQDPESFDTTNRQTNEKEVMCRFSIADNKRDKTQKPNWWQVKVFGPQAASCVQYLAQGRRVLVFGRLEQEAGQGQHEGRVFHTVYARDVRFLDAPDASPQAQPAQGEPQAQPQASAPAPDAGVKMPF